MNYNNKYLKYKSKYNLIKGGAMELFPDSKLIDSNPIDSNPIDSKLIDQSLIDQLITKFKNRAKIYLANIPAEEYSEYLDQINIDDECKLLSTKNNRFSKINVNIIESYINIMKKIEEIIRNLVRSENKQINNISWFNFNFTPTNQKKLAVLREYIVCILIVTTASINDFCKNSIPSIKVYKKMRTSMIRLSKEEYYKINISGSDQILSDIDINIYALNNSSFWISIIDDLLELIPWFNHSMWRVDVYADISSIINNGVEYFMNIQIQSNQCKKELLAYSIMSYFRHDNSNTFTSKEFEILQKFVKIYLNLTQIGNLDDNYFDELKTNAKEINYLKTKDKDYRIANSHRKTNYLPSDIGTIRHLYRETYYDKLIEIDKLTNNTDNKELNNINFIDNLIKLLAEANLYREENYLLLGTVQHIVKCSQQLKNKKTIDTDTNIIISNSSTLPILQKYEKAFILDGCKIADFTYVLSIIEQYGYMIHNLHHTTIEECNIAANKYFNRILDGLEKIKNNTDNCNTKYTDIKSKSSTLLEIKKLRSSQGDLNTNCDNDSFNLLEELDNILEKCF